MHIHKDKNLTHNIKYTVGKKIDWIGPIDGYVYCMLNINLFRTGCATLISPDFKKRFVFFLCVSITCSAGN